MKKIEAKIVADSIDTRGNRITSYILTYPRFIHSELMTHRMFSRNSASSRAIPFEKMVQSVKEDPFIPIAWQKDHKGMQGVEYIEGDSLKYIRACWFTARDHAVETATRLNTTHEITKQICNRLLEPFLWHTVLVTATEFDNFFELRCPKYTSDKGEVFHSKKDFVKAKDKEEEGFHYPCSEEGWRNINQSQAEIHIQALAEAMWDAYYESTPTKLKEGEWHIPFGDKLDKKEIDKFTWITNKERNLSPIATEIAIAVARCARLSYMTFNGEIDYQKDLALHDQLLKSKHASPMEHCAECQNNDNFYANFKGWKSYRKFLEEEGLL